jgi:hypothetical protein
MVDHKSHADWNLEALPGAAVGALRLERSDGVRSLAIACSQAALCETLKSAFAWKHDVARVLVEGAGSQELDTALKRRLVLAVDALYAESREEMMARASEELSRDLWPALEALVQKAQLLTASKAPGSKAAPKRM